jgi:F-type H+-transporting ATPase subunit delta
VRGMSRASLADVKERLDAVLAGSAASPGTAGVTAAQELGDQLFAVTGLLDDEASLRRILSDPSREARAKQSLAQGLLRGKIGDPALELVNALVGENWSEPADLPDATEQLAALAIVEAADRQGVLDDVEDELFRFGRVVNASPELRIALSDPFIAADRKNGLLQGLLGGKVTEPAMRLISQAADRPRGRSLDVSLQEYARLAAERRERLVAEVHVAIALTAQQRDRLRGALAASYGRDVHLNIVLDPRVIGGMSVQILDEIIDGTMAGRLAGLRRRMAA